GELVAGRRRELVNPDLYDVRAEVRVLDGLNLGVRVAERGQRVAHLRHARGAVQRRLDAGAGLEVDTQVDPEDGDGDRAGGDDRPGHREEPPREPGEVEPPADPLLRV